MKKKPMNWVKEAERVAEKFPLSSLHPEARHWFGKAPPGLVGVTCSGGADSLCLLLLLWAHFPERRSDFVVLHFDHRLRGEASRADAQFVEEVIGALGLRGRFGVWERQEGEAVSEETARKARFHFFYSALAGEGDGKKDRRVEETILFLGHQRDDVAETLLMRLSRGSGSGGLAAPRAVHVFRDGRVHLRPLLSMAGATIRGALEARDIPFRVDASNAGMSYYRNRVRQEVLPVWQRHSPFDVWAGAAASRELLQEDDDALAFWLREMMPELVAGQSLDLRPLAGKPAALMRRALHAWLVNEGLAARLSKRAFERLLEEAGEKRAFQMSAGAAVFLHLTAEGILAKTIRGGEPVSHFEEPWPLPPGGVILLPGGRSLQARAFPLDPETRDHILAGRVDSRIHAFLAWEGEQLWVRHRRAGDRFRPLGAPGSRKMQDMFVDLKLPEAERSYLPVVCVGDQILWAPSFPPAEVSKVSSLSKWVVQLTYDWGGAA